VTQEAGLVWRTFADVAGHPVVALAPVKAGMLGAVVHVDLAVVAFIAVDADAAVAAVLVGARCPILADVGPERAFVHILGTVAARVLSRAIAGVRVNPVHAPASILAKVAVAVVHIDVAPGAGEACNNNTKLEMAS
jgi:hypothetical protein